MIISFVNLSRIFLLLIGLNIHQSKSDSIRNGIIVNGANETVDGSIDKSAIQQQSVDNVSRNGSIQQSIIQYSDDEISFDEHLKQYLSNHPKAIVLQPNKKDDTSELKTISFNGAQDIEVVIHLLDINKYTNYMRINFTATQGTTQVYKFTDIIKPPNMKTITFNDIQELSIFLEFGKSESSRYQGYVITYQLHDKNTSDGNTVPVHQNTLPLEKLSILIEVPESKQNNETWRQFQELLAKCSNLYMSAINKSIENCSADNVTFDNVSTCKAAWPNAQKCVEVDFSVRLKAKTNDVTNEFYMNNNELLVMWIQFGRHEFSNNGYNEFPVPDSKKLLLLWTSVSLITVAAFLMVLTAIWKMDVLRDYRRMYWKSSDDEKQICKSSDTTMYPPVHQTVPTLFPNDLSAPYNTSNALPFEFVNKPITYSINDFKRRSSIAESLNPNGINAKRKAGDVPFQTDTDFNETKQAEDEVCFSNTESTSPRLVN